MGHKVYPRELGGGGPHWSDAGAADLAYFYDQIEKVIADGATEFVFVLSPATVDIPVDDALIARKVRVRVCDAAGNLHKWFNGAIDTAITKSSAAGTATNVASIDLVDGEGQIDVVTGGTWLADDTVTVTASAQTILGLSILAVNSVATIIANP